MVINGSMISIGSRVRMIGIGSMVLVWQKLAHYNVYLSIDKTHNNVYNGYIDIKMRVDEGNAHIDVCYIIS